MIHGPVSLLDRFHPCLPAAFGAFLVLCVLAVLLLRDVRKRRRIGEALRVSLERHRAVLETARDGFWLVDLQGRILEVNDAYCLMSGYTQKELLDMTVQELEAVESQGDGAVRFRNAVDGGKDRFESRHRRKDGSRFDVEIGVRTLSAEGGRFVAFLRDVTESRRAEERLRTAHERLVLSQQAAGSGIWIWDMRTERLEWTPEMYRLLGLDPLGSDASFDSWRMALHPEDREAAERRIQDSIRNHARLESEYRIVLPSGETRWIYALGDTEYDAQDRAVLMTGICLDISGRKRAEEALRSLAVRTDAILAAVPDIVVEVDERRRYTWANRAGLRFFGEDVVGREAADFFEGEQDTYGKVQPLFEGAEDVIYVESWQRRRDGARRLLSWWCKALKDGQGHLTGALSTARDITEERRAGEELRQSEEKFRVLVETASQGIVVVQDGRIRYANPQALRLFAATIGQVEAADYLDFTHPDDREMIRDRYRRRAQGEVLEGRAAYRILGAGGQSTWVEGYGNAIRWEGRPAYLVLLTDITERKRAEEERGRLEAQLLQSQKMESVGRLAGGVAHDFNNMLAVILGHVEMSLQQGIPSPSIQTHMTEIQKAANRSADLTRQLLAFARKQTVSPKVLDLNATIEGMLAMLRRLIGENIRLVWHPEADLRTVRMDPSQIDQILANLCVNARDAIDEVGQITIETGNRVLDDAYGAVHPGLAPGEYVLLAVSDDGCGMDRETQAHLFEPFYTTKGFGKGTGLGLATVYGIVKQNDGFINVYSELGQGTTFQIYLPRYAGGSAPARCEGPVEALPRGHETILLVEDERTVLDLTRQMLEGQGYAVLAAGMPGDAIRLAGEHAGEIHLLMSDVVMPEMNGRDLARTLLGVRPALKRLFMSGYTADVIAHHGVLDAGMHFIQKPFTLAALAAKVRETLDGQG